jgi:ADP-ribose pyrophosphatase YjhB (NUDIX family)
MPKTISVAGVVLRDAQGRYLLVKEKLPKVYGLWNLPAGHVDEGETLQQAAIREAKEETGYTVELVDDTPLVSVMNQRKFAQLNSFKAVVVGGDLTIQPEELLDAKWLTLDEINELDKSDKIRDPWVISSILKVNES